MAEYFKKDGDEYVKVEDTLFTQAEIDSDIMPKRLERERKKFADYDDLKEKAGKVDTIAAEYDDKLKSKDTELSTLQGELGKAKLETTKVKVMHEFKLSDDLAEFINGEDEKTIRTQAEKLSKNVPGSSVKIDKTPKPGDPKDKSDLSGVRKNLFGSKSSDD